MNLSIIVPVYNSAKILRVLVKKIKKNLKTKNYEIIFINDASSDNSWNEIKKISKKNKRIKGINLSENFGQHSAIFAGLKYAKGNVIVFVNSGDVLTTNALNIIYKKFKMKHKFDFVFGTVKRHYTKKTILKYGFNPNRLIYNFDFATAHSTGFFMKKSSILKVGKFNLKYKCSADYDMYYKAIIKLKMKGTSTRKKELIGIVSSGGYSSKISFLNHLIEETKIRLDNNQNIFFVLVIFLNAFAWHLLKKLY